MVMWPLCALGEQAVGRASLIVSDQYWLVGVSVVYFVLAFASVLRSVDRSVGLRTERDIRRVNFRRILSALEAYSRQMAAKPKGPPLVPAERSDEDAPRTVALKKPSEDDNVKESKSDDSDGDPPLDTPLDSAGGLISNAQLKPGLRRPPTRMATEHAKRFQSAYGATGRPSFVVLCFQKLLSGRGPNALLKFLTFMFCLLLLVAWIEPTGERCAPSLLFSSVFIFLLC